jgi:sugar phosphate isomerase/epimerase
VTILPHRRDFLNTTFAAGTTVALSPLSRLAGIEPIKRTGKANLKLSMAAYSYNRHLNLKSKKPPTMTLEDFIDIGGKLKLPAVELTAYYFPKTTPEYFEQIKLRCTKLDLAVSGTAVGNDFCWPEAKKLHSELDMVKQWIEHSAALGAKTMRIFAGSVKKGDTEEDARRRAIETIQIACDHAANYKVYLALENHGGITSTAEKFLQIVKAVKHDWFGVNLDTANFRTPDPYGDLEKAAPYAVTVQIKTEIHPAGKTEDADLKRLTGILRKANYQGYVALEYEAAEDPRTAVPRAIAELKKLMD